MFPSAVIKKDKKKLKGADKVESKPLEGIEEIEIDPIEKTIELEPKKFEGAKKMEESEVPKAIKPKSEDLVSIDLMMQSAKKKKPAEDVNAVSSEGEKFKVEKDEKGMWKESGASKEAYLKKLGKFKKGK